MRQDQDRRPRPTPRQNNTNAQDHDKYQYQQHPTPRIIEGELSREKMKLNEKRNSMLGKEKIEKKFR
jgi:hypothetical protein